LDLAETGAAEGRLVGGCIESVTAFARHTLVPDFQGAIFFFETSEEKPTPETLDGLLMDYENMGVFDRINGLLVGRPMSYNHEEKEQLRAVILETHPQVEFSNHHRHGFLSHSAAISAAHRMLDH
jgi:muramoyltetrapeptide carboxypeptidase LdcA involved in peptidoglycan recycling